MKKMRLITVVSVSLLLARELDADLVGPDPATRFNVVPVLITSDAAGTHTTTNGANAFGVDHHGVGRFNGCTASLLYDGRTILTAAHCLTGTMGTATFVNAAGTSFSQTVSSAAYQAHPSYNGTLTHGHDVAVVTFPVQFDASITRYGIVSSGFNAVGQQGVVFGSGLSGFGNTGATGAAGKRAGLNQYDSIGLGTKGEAGFLNDNTQLVSDVDNGTAAQDAFNVLYGDPADLGFGNDEVGFAPSDSGGPTFYQEGGVFRIGAVNSYVIPDIASDIDTDVDFTFGEFNVSANLGDASMNSFVVTAIPEPSPVWLLSLIGIGSLLYRRTRIFSNRSAVHSAAAGSSLGQSIIKTTSR